MPYVAMFQRFSLPRIRIDILSAVILLIFLCGWHGHVTGHLSAGPVLLLVLFVAVCVAYGNLFTRLIAPLFEGVAGLPFQMLSGYFIFNSLLFILALGSPFGMALNLAFLAVLAVVGLIVFRRRPLPRADASASEHWAGCAVIFLSCLGATIWCLDAQAPLFQNGNMIVRIWNDVYIHVREISVFAQAHGIASVQDIKLAGGRAPIYHFASYMTPAAMSALSGATALQEYASLQLPLGIVLTGLAAYCFMGKLFGWGPGVAATVAIVLCPDAFQQGFQSRYLSYNFMAQVNLGMLYGISCAAMAWMFMLDGCRRGKFGLIVVSYLFLAICLFYKAHLFVANSYVLMMFPFVFFTPLRRSLRFGLGIAATVVFCLVIAASQSNPRVPVLRLDGSGIGKYMVQLLHYATPGWISHQVERLLVVEKHGFAVQALCAAAFLLVSTFGFWLAGLVAALVKGRRAMPVMFWAFPIVVVGNYLVMSMGLAFDNRNIGTADELLSRPLVWAYFGVATWTTAVGYRLLIGAEAPRGKSVFGAALAVVLCLGGALYSTRNLQTFPEVPTNASFVVTGSVPDCLVQAATFLRTRSAQSDVVQDAAADPLFVFTALAERQLYVGEGQFGGRSVTQKMRLADVAGLVQSSDPVQIQQFFATNRVNWFLQRPDTALAWPQATSLQPAFSCGGFRLFHFAGTAPVPAASIDTTNSLNHKGS